MEQNSELNIGLRQAVIAIESAVSLATMSDKHHSKRVANIAVQLGKDLGFSDDDINDLFELGMLHDCGVSSKHVHCDLVDSCDWNDAYIHCNVGYELLNNFRPLSKYSISVLYHHTPWVDLLNKDISRHDAIMANLIYLSDRIDVLATPYYGNDISLGKKKILDTINGYSGHFKPEFVKACHKVIQSDSFWLSLQDTHITRYTWDMSRQPERVFLSYEEIKEFALIMAYIVDQKSSFTLNHSLGVSDVASFLAKSLKLSESQCKQIEIAALLHGIGSLHIPDTILEKSSPLSAQERSIINQTSYETYEILRHIDGLGEIARWAAFHHESINNSGYPFHPHEYVLPIEARIIQVAKVFQALSQDRAYRKGMELPQIIKTLDQDANTGKLDKQIVSHVKAVAGLCFNLINGNNLSESNTALLELHRKGLRRVDLWRKVHNTDKIEHPSGNAEHLT